MVQHKDVKQLDCPAQSSDLNPVKKFWKIVKEVAKQNRQNKKDVGACKDRWYTIPVSTCKKIVQQHTQKF